jgi:aspartate dehydrogenase
MKKIGIIGCGSIATVLAKAIDEGIVNADIISLFDFISEKCYYLAANLKNSKPLICKNFNEFLKSSSMDLVVEAASQEAVKEYVPKLLNKGVDVVILSVGALLDEKFYSILLRASKAGKSKVYIPSGAIAGIDAIKAASLVGIKEVILVTRKNPKSLSNESLKKLGIDPNNVREAVKVYEGQAEKAVHHFPANINVAATLKLASNAPVKVLIYADPNISKNIHEIFIKSDVGEINIRIQNVTHPENRKTSYIAALSAVQLLKQLCNGVITIGT